MASSADSHELNLKTLLDRELIEVHFQPIYSIREKKMIGFEGLSRGVHPVTGKLISPLALQKMAKENGLILELDRLFRKKILEIFKQCFPPPHDLILSINFETSIIDREIGTLHLIHFCHQLNINPSNIVIEILESKIRSVEALAKFVQIHRDHGFLIALDDVGKGHSNLDRIPVIQPDVIKIDRSLVMNLHEDYYRQEIFKSLVQLSHKIGALALAEGVETEEETLQSLELGADLLQGFYLAKPQEPSREFVGLSINTMDPLADKFRRQMVEKINIRKMQHERYGLMINSLVGELSNLSQNQLNQDLPLALLKHTSAQAIYVLDQKGLQISEMSLKTSQLPRQGIFRKPLIGTDYSTRDFFYILMEPDFKRDSYTSEPYISPATGIFCVTISARFKGQNGNPWVLCVDVVPTYLKNMGRIMTLFGS